MPRARVRRATAREIQGDESQQAEVEAAAVVSHDAAADSSTRAPADWRKGALLNVRNYGSEYVITLYPEELDHDKPERALHFTNPALCQDFVSNWYQREHCDPRAR